MGTRPDCASLAVTGRQSLAESSGFWGNGLTRPDSARAPVAHPDKQRPRQGARSGSPPGGKQPHAYSSHTRTHIPPSLQLAPREMGNQGRARDRPTPGDERGGGGRRRRRGGGEAGVVVVGWWWLALQNYARTAVTAAEGKRDGKRKEKGGKISAWPLAQSQSTLSLSLCFVRVNLRSRSIFLLLPPPQGRNGTTGGRGWWPPLPAGSSVTRCAPAPLAS